MVGDTATTFLKSLPHKPGVYQMLDEAGTVIYVGKARDLKKRVSSYFRRQHESAKTAVLVQQIRDVQVTITHSENEALLLECNLIKTLKPRYNILFRDDKSYPYIYLSSADKYPRLDFYRGSKQKKGDYFGPYPSVVAVRETLQLLQKLFKVRQCKDSFFKNRTRPCLQYQIKRCSAPCVEYISPEQYQQDVDHVRLLLQGKSNEVLQRLTERMDTASQALNYEAAAIYRDQIQSLRHIQERQYVTGAKGDTDVFALVSQAGVNLLQVLHFRQGELLGNQVYMPSVPENMELNEAVESFLSQFYLTAEQHIPEAIIINCELPDAEWLATSLRQQVGHRVMVSHQVRGDRAKWLQLAVANAEQSLAGYLADAASYQQRLLELQQILALSSVPKRMECFDISHSQGEATVASCVVFDDQGPQNSEYRRFNIRGIEPGDDYAAIHQALYRRYKKRLENEQQLPDVIFIDGGKGQLGKAIEALEELGITSCKLVGVSKGPSRKAGLEQLWIAGVSSAISLPTDSPALHIIQQIRDEAHRFAILGHRRKREKRGMHSQLEDIPGIGPKRRRELLRHFGGVQAVKRASINELAKVNGISRASAEAIYNFLHGT